MSRLHWEIDGPNKVLIGYNGEEGAFKLYNVYHPTLRQTMWQVDRLPTGQGLGVHTTLESALRTAEEAPMTLLSHPQVAAALDTFAAKTGIQRLSSKDVEALLTAILAALAEGEDNLDVKAADWQACDADGFSPELFFRHLNQQHRTRCAVLRQEIATLRALMMTLSVIAFEAAGPHQSYDFRARADAAHLKAQDLLRGAP